MFDIVKNVYWTMYRMNKNLLMEAKANQTFQIDRIYMGFVEVPKII